jgi:hypothetical protein
MHRPGSFSAFASAVPPTLPPAPSPTFQPLAPAAVRATRRMPPARLDRSQWDRIALAPDIELHVRRPLSRLVNKRVDRLVAAARQLLEEDPS